MLIKLKDSIKNWIYSLIPPPSVNESFSQAGEDCCVEFLFSQLNITQPSYLELGVCEPKYGSNTFKFYKKGSRGVLVEADSNLIPKIQQDRKEDLIINLGVGTGELHEADFFIFEMAAHNTFNKEEADFRIKNGSYKLLRTEKVKLISVHEIIRNHFQNKIPDFLSIDIEGMDLAVLKSINFNTYPIPVICAETCVYSESHIKPQDKSITEFMEANGYFTYANTYINTIFVNTNWFNKPDTTL